jgi:hypothetical protein
MDNIIGINLLKLTWRSIMPTSMQFTFYDPNNSADKKQSNIVFFHTHEHGVAKFAQEVLGLTSQETKVKVNGYRQNYYAFTCSTVEENLKMALYFLQNKDLRCDLYFETLRFADEKIKDLEPAKQEEYKEQLGKIINDKYKKALAHYDSLKNNYIQLQNINPVKNQDRENIIHKERDYLIRNDSNKTIDSLEKLMNCNFNEIYPIVHENYNEAVRVLNEKGAEVEIIESFLDKIIKKVKEAFRTTNEEVKAPISPIENRSPNVAEHESYLQKIHSSDNFIDESWADQIAMQIKRLNDKYQKNLNSKENSLGFWQWLIDNFSRIALSSKSEKNKVEQGIDNSRENHFGSLLDTKVFEILNDARRSGDTSPIVRAMKDKTMELDLKLQVITKLLEEKKCDINQVEKGQYRDHLTPLEYLLSHYDYDIGTEGALEIATLLIEKGASLKAQSDGALSPLHYAVTSQLECALDIMKLMIDKGANVNYLPAANVESKVNFNYVYHEIKLVGASPLELAAISRNAQKEAMIELLTDNGAGLSRKTSTSIVNQYKLSVKWEKDMLGCPTRVNRSEKEIEHTEEMLREASIIKPSTSQHESRSDTPKDTKTSVYNSYFTRS